MIPITTKTHAHLGWRETKGFGFARQLTLVPLATEEIGRVSQVMPVVFHKREDVWEAVGVMGPVKATNVYVVREGKWRGSFVPACLRVYPFCLDDVGELALWEGYKPEPLAADGVEPFYDGVGWSARLAQTKQFLTVVRSSIRSAAPVLEQLEALGVLIPWAVPGIDKPRPEIALRGLFAVDPKALGGIGDELALSLMRSGALRWLYAHSESLHHALRFKTLAEALFMPQLDAPQKTERLDGAVDILAAIAEDLGDTEL